MSLSLTINVNKMTTHQALQKKLIVDILELHDPDFDTFEENLRKYLGVVSPKKEVQTSSPKKVVKKVVSKKAAPKPPIATKPLKKLEEIVTETNDWGNQEAEGYVFLELPAGIGGSVVEMAIGRQDETSEEEGLASVKKLTKKDIELAQEANIPVLTPAAKAVLKKKSQKKYGMLEEVGLM